MFEPVEISKSRPSGRFSFDQVQDLVRSSLSRPLYGTIHDLSELRTSIRMGLVPRLPSCNPFLEIGSLSFLRTSRDLPVIGNVQERLPMSVKIVTDFYISYKVNKSLPVKQNLLVARQEYNTRVQPRNLFFADRIRATNSTFGFLRFSTKHFMEYKNPVSFKD